MIKLREYQQRSIDCVFEYFQKGGAGNPLVCAPTGTGKSVMIAGFIRQAFKTYGRQKILVATHVKELVDQNHQKLVSMWDCDGTIGINAASLKQRSYGADVIFCNIKSIAANPQWFGKVDLVIIDEAHLVNPTGLGQYVSVIKELQSVNKWLKVIGYTATPWRLGHGHICEDGIFTDVALDLTTLTEYNKLIADYYLCKLVSRPTDVKYDLSNLHMRGGDFIESEVQAAMDKDELTYQALQYSLPYFEGRRSGIIFCAGIRHAQSAANMMNYFGVPTAVVHSKSTDKERDAAIQGLKNGTYRFLTNSNILTTGVDIPHVDFLIDLKPTNSSVLRNQMYGRATRMVFADGFDLSTLEGRHNAAFHGGKHNALVLDFVGNTERLGPINDPVPPRRKGKASGDVPVKICPHCGCYNHTRSVFCDMCGYEFPKYSKINDEASSAKLIAETDVDAPVWEELAVSHRTTKFGLTKQAGRPYVQITYYCNAKTYTEFRSFEFQKDRDWWAKHVRDEFKQDPIPNSSSAAIEQFDKIKIPSHIIAWVNKKPYPAVSELVYKSPQEPVIINSTPSTLSAMNGDFDDDIPF